MCGFFITMKKIILLSGILLISTTLSAQVARSATAAKQRLDSIVSARSRMVYTYDANGKTMLELTSSWDSIKGEWVGVDKIEKVNDANGNGLIYARYYWDEVLNQWAGVNKFNWSWDENGGVLMYTLSTAWDAGTGQFIPGIKYENIRNQDGNRTSYIKYQWDTDSSKYLRSEKVT